MAWIEYYIGDQGPYYVDDTSLEYLNDGQLVRRAELTAVAPAVGDTATINLTLTGNTITADATLGTAAGMVANGSIFDLLSTHEALTSAHGTAGSVVGTSQSQTLTNKIISLTTNTISGTLNEFNAALTGATFATLDGAETFTNKKFGGITDYAEFESDGSLRFYGNATCFTDGLGPLIAQKVESPSSDIVANNSNNSLTIKKTATTADYITMNLQNHHGWKPGSAIKPHLHWEQASSTLPNLMIQYRWQVNGSAKTTSWTSLARVSEIFTYTSGTLNQITTFGSITPGSYNISDIIQFRVIRDSSNLSGLFAGADALNASIEAVSFDAHIEFNQFASRSEYTV